MMRTSTAMVIIALALGLGALAPSLARAQDCPEPVKTAALKRLGHTRFISATTVTEQGRTLFKVLVASEKYANRKHEVIVTPEGEALRDAPMYDRPESVTLAIEKAYPKSKLQACSTDQDERFRLTIETGEKHTLLLTVTADGKLIQTEEKIDVRDLPEVVQKALQAKYKADASYAGLEEARRLTRMDPAADGKASQHFRIVIRRKAVDENGHPMEEQKLFPNQLVGYGLSFALFTPDGTFEEECEHE